MEPTHDAITCPEDVLRQIPWYDDPGLGAEERGRIEAHAAECAACSAEIAWGRGEEIPAAPAAASADAVYERVRARMHGVREPARPSQASQEASPEAVAAGGQWRQIALAAGIAGAALLLGVAAGRGLFPGESFPAETQAVYRTAAEAPVQSPSAAVAEGARMDVIFRADAPAERITDALRAIGGTVVEGPSRLGVYRLRLTAGADGAAAAKLLRREGEGVATFAEVVR